MNECAALPPASEITVGPEPMTAGSSSVGACTSDKANVIERPARCASFPPLIADSCLRTALISAIGRPLASSSRVTAILCSRVTPSAGAASIADAPPDNRTTSSAPWARLSSARCSACTPAAKLASSGTGCPPRAMSTARVRSRYRSRNASAIGCAALPAAISVNRSCGGKVCASSARSSSSRASHAASAPEKIAWRSARRSVIVLRVGPAGQTRHDVELAQQRAHHLRRVVFRADALELAEHTRDGAVGVGDCTFGVVLALERQAFPVLQKLRAIEVGQYRFARNPYRADKACHATPRLGHMGADGSSLDGAPRSCQRIVGTHLTDRAITNPPRHPSAIPPTTSRSKSCIGTKATPVSPTASDSRLP